MRHWFILIFRLKPCITQKKINKKLILIENKESLLFISEVKTIRLFSFGYLTKIYKIFMNCEDEMSFKKFL